nr:unnamed protein product [Digitaria exilis]
MAAAGDSATVFLETTLGTRLVVSFPARATTVADLKRQVSAEHAAGFPRAGPIAVTSLQVELDGSWFQLTDSMAVRAAFEWVKGPWRLRAEVHQLCSHPISRKDAKCGTGDAEPNAGNPVISENSSQYMLLPAVSHGGYGSLASCDGVSDTDTAQMGQQNKPQKGFENASVQCRDGITILQESSDIDLGACDGDTLLPNQDKLRECVEDGSDQLEDGINRPKENSEFDLGAGDSDAPPLNLQDKSHEGAEHASGQSEDRITMPEESSDLGIAAEKGNSPVGGQQKDIIAEPRGKKRFREGDKTVAHELRSHQLARKDAKCGTGDTEPNGGPPVISENYSQYTLRPASSQGGGSFASGDGVSDTDTPQTSQKNKPQEGVENASVQCRDGTTMPEESSGIELATGESDTPLPNQEDKPRECVERGSDQPEDGTTMPQESSDIEVATGDSDAPLPNQDDKPLECVEHGSDQPKDGIAMPEESSEFDFAAGDCDTPPMNKQDKSHEGVEHASGQSQYRITMFEESSDLGIAADKGNSSVGGQQKDIIVEPRGKKCFREGDKTNERIVANCGDNLSSLASSTLNAELSQKKSCVTVQAKSNSVPLLYDLEGCEHDLGEKPSGGQDPSISGVHNGESSSNGSDLPPCVDSMERKKSSDKEVRIQRGDEDGPCMAGRAGKSICKRTDAPHCVETMKEDVKRPTFNSHYIDRGQNEGSTSTVNREHEPCFRKSHRRIVVRKIPISRAMKVYSFR